ncbi:unnamed protein product, partial [Callosobruchus maculatus]
RSQALIGSSSGEFPTALRALSSAASFPAIPTCPGVQTKIVTLHCCCSKWCKWRISWTSGSVLNVFLMDCRELRESEQIK